MGNFFVLLGPPGAGKGTQAEIVSKEFGLPHISSGNIFRENLQNETELGIKAKAFMEAGELVPDDLTIEMVKDRLVQPDCENGAILDGFPRTPTQAQALDEFLNENGHLIKAVPLIDVQPKELIERLSGRWTCKDEGHVFHLKYKPPQKPGICDIDGSALYQRKDDKKETVTQRIKVYDEQTAPLKDFYDEKGKLIQVDGDQPIENVTKSLKEIIGGK